MAALEIAEEERSHTLFSVLPDHYNNEIIGLDTIIEKQLALLPEDPAIRAQMTLALFASLQTALTQLGLPIPLASIASFVSKGDPDPASVVKTFSLLSASALHASFFAKHQLRDIKAEAKPARKQFIEGNTFDLDHLEEFLASNQERIIPEEDFPLKPVDPLSLPGLYFGTKRRWNTPPAIRGVNVLFAEIFTRLMYNYAATPGSPIQAPPGATDPSGALFSVVFHGKVITRVDDLFEELEKEEGASLVGGMLKSCARFGVVLSYQDPEQPYSPFLDVPFTLFIGTGIISRTSGKQAYVPMVHAAVFLEFKSPRFNFDIEFYLGTGSAAQFRDGSKLLMPWAQPLATHVFPRNDLLKAVRACALHGSILGDLAIRDRLENSGYGASGVCTDSVAPIEQLILGKTTVYPLLAMIGCRTNMLSFYKQLAVFFKEQLAANSAFIRQSDIDLVLALPRATAALPSDVELSLLEYNNTLHRILDTLPWAPGQEPFKHAVRARYIIQKELASPWFFEE